MPSSLQHTLCKTPVLLQRVKKEEEKKKKASTGWTEKPFFPGDTHFGLRGSGFVRAPPLRAPAPPPTATAPLRFPRPPASREKRGLLGALSQGAVGVPGDAPRGEEEVSPGKRALSRGSRGRPQQPQRPERFRPESRGPRFFPRAAQRRPRWQGRPPASSSTPPTQPS